MLRRRQCDAGLRGGEASGDPGEERKAFVSRGEPQMLSYADASSRWPMSKKGALPQLVDLI